MIRLAAALGLAGLVCSAPAFAQSAPAGASSAPDARTSLANCEPLAGPATAPSGALHVSGAQMVDARGLFGVRDTLIVAGGSSRGLAVGQRFFVNDTTAIAVVDFMCDAVMTGDFLEPYTEASMPETAMSTDASGDLDFSSLGHVLFADADRTTGGGGTFMITDMGGNRGAAVGTRFAIYRDMASDGSIYGKMTKGAVQAGMLPSDLPLQAIGEAVVVAADADTSVVRLTLTRDAVRGGDLLVPRHASSSEKN
jgi:hypothetical protein